MKKEEKRRKPKENQTQRAKPCIATRKASGQAQATREVQRTDDGGDSWGGRAGRMRMLYLAYMEYNIRLACSMHIGPNHQLMSLARSLGRRTGLVLFFLSFLVLLLFIFLLIFYCFSTDFLLSLVILWFSPIFFVSFTVFTGVFLFFLLFFIYLCFFLRFHYYFCLSFFVFLCFLCWFSSFFFVSFSGFADTILLHWFSS